MVVIHLFFLYKKGKLKFKPVNIFLDSIKNIHNMMMKILIFPYILTKDTYGVYNISSLVFFH